MTKEQSILAEKVLLWVELGMFLEDGLKHIPQVGQITLQIGSVNQEMVQEHNAASAGNVKENPLNQSLEGCWGVAEA